MTRHATEDLHNLSDTSLRLLHLVFSFLLGGELEFARLAMQGEYQQRHSSFYEDEPFSCLL